MQVTTLHLIRADLGTGKTLSENYVLIKNKGAIAFVASSHYGVVNYLNLLLTNLYNLISHADYGKSIGTIESDAGKELTYYFANRFYGKLPNRTNGHSGRSGHYHQR